ncbi:hypothetical protein BV20DRAFT_529006 [Pilatotrama ljubarskyi]|nr:hypothetical protein BV20DRAFT_529006 [Pilatotrama ljubarskyi]
MNAKALHIKNAPRECAVYVPTSDACIQSHVFAPTPITGSGAEESPAVFTRVGKGYLGYIGDVNAEQVSIRLTIEMLGVKVRPGVLGSRTLTTSVSWHPATGRSVETRVEEEISLPEPPRPPRVREGEVAARARQRTKVREEKNQHVQLLRDEEYTFFKREQWLQAAKKYHAAAMVAGPQTVVMSNLATALLKLQLWELADSAASRALVHDPDSCQGVVPQVHRAEGDGASPSSRSRHATRSATRWQHQLQENKRPPRYDWPGDELLGHGFGPEADGPIELENESDSEDAKQEGNGMPCKLYNRDGCAQGQRCRFSHAPDGKSVRDELCIHGCMIGFPS